MTRTPTAAPSTEAPTRTVARELAWAIHEVYCQELAESETFTESDMVRTELVLMRLRDKGIVLRARGSLDDGLSEASVLSVLDGILGNHVTGEWCVGYNRDDPMGWCVCAEFRGAFAAALAERLRSGS